MTMRKVWFKAVGELQLTKLRKAIGILSDELKTFGDSHIVYDFDVNGEFGGIGGPVAYVYIHYADAKKAVQMLKDMRSIHPILVF